VEIGLIPRRGENIVRVKDTGVGISEHERDAVLRRFYRSERAGHISGLGPGLNLVAAIVRLYGFRLTIVPGSGCLLACPAVNVTDDRPGVLVNPVADADIQSA
jgi:signal transduction histidine kinase